VPLRAGVHPRAIMYADASYEAGDLSKARAGGLQQPRAFRYQVAKRHENGWGLVVFPHGGASPVFAAGRVPARILDRFRKRKQYIFLLETAAQCMAMWCFWPELRPRYWGFCDNTAGEASLWKGYSTDSEVSISVSLHWLAAVRVGAYPWTDRVPTGLQVADDVSRHDYSKAASLGWSHAELDLARVWQQLTDWVIEAIEPTVDHVHTLLELTREARTGAGLNAPELP